MLVKTVKFPVELGPILDRAVRVGGIGLKALPDVSYILQEYKIQHLCVILKNYITSAICTNNCGINDLKYDVLASVEHILDTFGSDDVDELIDTLNSGTYKCYSIDSYITTDVATEVTFTIHK